MYSVEGVLGKTLQVDFEILSYATIAHCSVHIVQIHCPTIFLCTLDIPVKPTQPLQPANVQMKQRGKQMLSWELCVPRYVQPGLGTPASWGGDGWLELHGLGFFSLP